MDISHDLQQSGTRLKTFSYVHLILRIITGILLGLKGFYFVRNAEILHDLVMKTSFSGQANFFVSYITWAHMLGGAFIILGLLTRIAVVLQIPVLLAAVIFNLSSAHLANTSEGIHSFIVLALLVFILIRGAGKISMDYYLKRHKL